MGLPPRSTITPRVLQKVIWAGANNSSYPLASSALLELAGLRLSPKQIRHALQLVGAARLAEREQAVENLQARTLPARRAGNPAARPPELAVILMDGGRYQRRDNFRSEPTREPGGQHWREDKVGCLLSMSSAVRTDDPQPEFPTWLATSAAVAELAKMAEKKPLSTPQAGPPEGPPGAVEPALYEPPELLSREVIASGADSERFGWLLEARAWELGFPTAPRQAFVADGAAANWNVQRRHFPRATPILDLMHALSYAWAAAEEIDGGASYPPWAEWIWQGKVTLVLAALAEHQAGAEPPPAEETPQDTPREPIARAHTYFTNNLSRMNYPAYRQQGLPLTSSHIESTIKQINQRVKGTEKFWCRHSAEAVLQLRADTLSDSQPLAPFWHRWFQAQTGANSYHTAT